MKERKKRVDTSLYLDADIYERFKNEAEQFGLTISQYLRLKLNGFGVTKQG